MKRCLTWLALLLVPIILMGCTSPGTTSTSASPTQASQTPAITSAVITTQPTSVKVTNPPTTTSLPKTTQPSVKVAGMVYYRDSITSFPVDAAPRDKALEKAEVSIASQTALSDASGNYVLSVVPGYQTILVKKPGYITTKMSWDLSAGQNYVFNIGLYKAQGSLNPRPGFVNGLITWDAGGWLIDYYYNQGLFQPTYSVIKDQSGANLVTVSDPIFIKQSSSTKVVMSTTSNEGNYWRMMNEAEYTVLAKDAHSKGLQFMIWLGVIDGGGTTYFDSVYSGKTLDPAFWDSWFAEYQKYTLQYATMAEKLGIEYISLGHDMGYAIGASRFAGGHADCQSRWANFIGSIRQVYQGKLVYFAGSSPLDNYYESNDFPDGFVELFDVIGLNIQAINTNFNPALDELKGSISVFLDRYAAWKRPLFIMLRTPSVDGGTSFETYIEPLLVVNHEADKHKMNLWQQADIYEAFSEVINNRPTGNGQVMGLFSWGYNYLDNYLSVPGKSDGAMAMDKSGNIRGKPAEAVLKWWGNK